MNPQNRSYIPELDGLRAIAALGVVALHWSPTYTFWMWSFVDLFFVLSGFLITRILLLGLREGRLTLKAFWIARIFRIWPVYYLALLGVCLYHLAASGSGFFTDARVHDVLLSALFLQFTPLYGDIGADPMGMFQFLPGFLHSWSLAVEEQFYLLWPLLLGLLLRRRDLRWTALACVLLLIAAPLMRAAGMAPALLFARLDGLALGALIAVIQVQALRAPQRSLSTSMCAGLYGGAAVLGLWLTLPYVIKGYSVGVSTEEALQQPLLVTGFALLYFALVGFIVRFPPQRLFHVLTLRPLVYLGGISYAIYMFHFPILAFLKPAIADWIATHLGARFHLLSHALVLSLIIGLPHLSRVCLERPLLAVKDRLLKRAA